MTSRRISLRKRSTAEAPADVPPDDASEPVRLGKGRPTPKRSEAQRRRGGPVAPPPATRREAAKRLRARQAEARKGVRDGTIAGDQSRMLPRDAGPARALVRDLVDGRRNFAVVLLPVALVLVLAQFLGNPAVLSVAARLWTATLLVVVADLIAIALVLRRKVGAVFPGERVRGHVGYGLLRSTVFRRFRMPPPRVRPRGLLRR